MEKKKIDLIFVIVLTLKGIFAAVEIVAGFFALFITPATLIHITKLITRDELLEDPTDRFSNYLVKIASHLSGHNKIYLFIYLVSHGLIKLLVVISLYQKQLWAYTLSYVVIAGFIVYQIIEYIHTHSLWLIVLTIIDIFIMWLIWKEQTYIKHRHRAHQ